jgi:hypothetical protein
MKGYLWMICSILKVGVGYFKMLLFWYPPDGTEEIQATWLNIAASGAKSNCEIQQTWSREVYNSAGSCRYVRYSTLTSLRSHVLTAVKMSMLYWFSVLWRRVDLQVDTNIPDWDSKSLRKVGIWLKVHTALQPRRQYRHVFPTQQHASFYEYFHAVSLGAFPSVFNAISENFLGLTRFSRFGSDGKVQLRSG